MQVSSRDALVLRRNEEELVTRKNKEIELAFQNPLTYSINWEDRYARKKDRTDECEHPSKFQSALLKFDTENILLLTFIISFATLDDVGRNISCYQQLIMPKVIRQKALMETLLASAYTYFAVLNFNFFGTALPV